MRQLVSVAAFFMLKFLPDYSWTFSFWEALLET